VTVEERAWAKFEKLIAEVNESAYELGCLRPGGHGTTTRYARGCRCSTCRYGWKLAAREKKARRLAKEAVS
jgi:hypothetical protein